MCGQLAGKTVNLNGEILVRAFARIGRFEKSNYDVAPAAIYNVLDLVAVKVQRWPLAFRVKDQFLGIVFS